MLESLYEENKDNPQFNREFTDKQIINGIALTGITCTLLWMAIVFGAFLIVSD